MFWKNLAKSSTHGGAGGRLPDGPLKQAVHGTFGSLEELKKKFNAAALSIQGSGWCWLVSLHLSWINTGGADAWISFPPLGIEPRWQTFGDHHHSQPGPSLAFDPYHRCRHVGARLLPSVQKRQGRCEFFTCLPLTYQTFLTRPIQYIEAIWNVINFDEAGERYANGLGSIAKGIPPSKV